MAILLICGPVNWTLIGVRSKQSCGSSGQWY